MTFTCHLRVRCLVFIMISCIVLFKRKLSRLCRWIILYRYRLSISLSALLLISNIIIFDMSCEGLKNQLNPVHLAHGYAPIYPYHYYHQPDILNATKSILSKNWLKTPKKLNTYLQQNVFPNVLQSAYSPIVHVIWCDGGSFTFVNFLSVLSVYKVFTPTIVYLYLTKEPELDPDGYYQFLPDLERDLLPLVKVTLTGKDICGGDKEDKILAYLNLLNSHGGIAINGRTLLPPSKNLKHFLENKISIATNEMDTEPLIISAERNVILDTLSKQSLSTFLQSSLTKYLKCGTILSMSPNHICAFMQEELFPVNIFNKTSYFDHLARWVAYGTSESRVSKSATQEIVPNIVHYVWLGKRKLDFFSFLSLQSSLHVLKADAVYIHGDVQPFGEHWDQVKLNTRVKFIHRDFPNAVYGEPIKLYASHASDYLRADILLRYGGIYVDWDVIFLQEMPLDIRLHNTTANVDWPETGAFPDVFNLGVLVSAPGAPYLQYFLESYRWYLDRHWSYNAIHMPYKVYEKQPQTLNVNRHLQILCALNKCHAPWMDGYKQETIDHLKSPDLHWQTDALAIHWTHPDPEEFSSKEMLLKSETITGEIGKNVLKKSGLI
ncbi:uncharacterized protein LOC106060100 [Biomphalaria glabrata]|uniref:Uncharacterized protein LOC106060100 n=1 Tax=Biomphalaria glabrata TaxID=6526 RepID=A0A9W3AHK7_BIOGL|nr:uncharacterized protein LOC106060100 [Biomphalaria glabrata]XP_055886720.1 uncharacterized protein LOC106060100 [Biomphalaria glabrata]XP_055886721.1 uncharacterized protein LOC106060100 [Biomphalaria glabrata]XP_055886722.1 uncharacterized protein LOC106060100 [Biomphalaria glabrata]XP_055886723.1 uncharacterized protein LOC106060100 [Biomphalaria glabrata]